MRPWAWRTQLSIFFAAYVLYDAARWIFASDPDRARVHAEWIIDLERSVHVAVEGPVQSALGSGAPIWILSNVYLAAQLVVLPLSLIWLYRRSRPIYRALRNTVIATWLIAVPIFALFPVAPPRLAGIGIADTVSSQAGVGLTGRSTLFYNPFAAVPSLHVGDRRRLRGGAPRTVGQGAGAVVGPARVALGRRHRQPLHLRHRRRPARHRRRLRRRARCPAAGRCAALPASASPRSFSMTALALLIGRIPDGWAVYLSNGVELARYRGFFAKRRALRFASHYS